MFSIFGVILSILCVSQLYWFWRASVLIRKAFRKTSARLALGGTALAVYFLMLAFNVGLLNGRHTPIYLTPGEGASRCAFRRRSLWVVPGAAQPGNPPPTHPPGAPPQGIPRLTDRATFRYSHRAVHDAGPNPEIRGNRQRAQARSHRADGRFCHLGSGDPAGRRPG